MAAWIENDSANYTQAALPAIHARNRIAAHASALVACRLPLPGGIGSRVKCRRFCGVRLDACLLDRKGCAV